MKSTSGSKPVCITAPVKREPPVHDRDRDYAVTGRIARRITASDNWVFAHGCLAEGQEVASSNLAGPTIAYQECLSLPGSQQASFCGPSIPEGVVGSFGQRQRCGVWLEAQPPDRPTGRRANGGKPNGSAAVGRQRIGSGSWPRVRQAGRLTRGSEFPWSVRRRGRGSGFRGCTPGRWRQRRTGPAPGGSRTRTARGSSESPLGAPCAAPWRYA